MLIDSICSAWSNSSFWAVTEKGYPITYRKTGKEKKNKIKWKKILEYMKNSRLFALFTLKKPNMN